VRIVRARITPFALRLRAPLATAHGRIEQRSGWLLELAGEGGLWGLGEASPLDGFGLESHAEAGRALESLVRAAIGRDLAEASALGLPTAPREPAARAAFDTALYDLAAREAGCSVAAWLGGRAGHEARTSVAVHALVAGDEPEAVTAAGRRAAAEGFETFKLKLAARPLDADLARVGALRQAIGPRARLRVDANGAWSEIEAERALAALAAWKVELVEQPIDARNLAGLARLRRLGHVPVAADESAAGEDAAGRVLAAGAADWIVLKPAASGGLAASARIAVAARAAGVGVFVTSFLDSAVGAVAALQLAASLPPPLPACGLATDSLFVEDLAAVPGPRAGRLACPAAPGLGITIDPARLARVATGVGREIGA